MNEIVASILEAATKLSTYDEFDSLQREWLMNIDGDIWNLLDEVENGQA